MENSNCIKKYLAEMIGTFTLVLIGCGTAVITRGNVVATALAFGLAIVAMAYSIGKISGCHVNPAVSFAMWVAKKLSFKDFIMYTLFQMAGAIVAILIVRMVSGDWANLGANNLNAISGSNGMKIGTGIVVEIVLTFIFVMAVFGATVKKSENGFAGLIIGAALTLVHLFGINITGTSVNPARSFAPAVLSAGADMTNLREFWIFLIAPMIGALLAALVWKCLIKHKEGELNISEHN